MIRKKLVMIALLLIFAALCFGHRPYEERDDITLDNIWVIKRPDISTAIYATLESKNDIDYYSFELEDNDSLYLSMVIPVIEGQEGFAPTMVLLGPDISISELDKPTDVLNGNLLEPGDTFKREFFEPFSRTNYWIWQEKDLTIKNGGEYHVVVFDKEKRPGRYVFTIGRKERPGGDMGFLFFRFEDYWTPVVPKENE